VAADTTGGRRRLTPGAPAGRSWDVRDLTTIVLLGILPCLAFLYYLRAMVADGSIGDDFEIFWRAGSAILHGDSPYPPPDREVLASEDEFVYPAPAGLAAALFAWLPTSVAEAAFLVLLTAAVGAALWSLGVRDWRCYGAAFLSRPTIDAILTGTVSPLLLLGVALLWRYRNRAYLAGGIAAGIVVLKLFLWPLLVWLLVSRRVRSALVAVLLATVVSLASWAVIGFAGLTDYPSLLRALADDLEGKGYSLVALGLASGLDVSGARLLMYAAGAALLAAVVRWSVPGEVGDRRSLAAAVGAALALSPIVWSHYWVLLLAPLALARPRWSPLWLLPIAFSILPGQSTGATPWEPNDGGPTQSDPTVGRLWIIATGIAIAAVTVALSLRASPRDPTGVDTSGPTR
jgi:Glycosyltransferase family 87